MRSSHNEDNNIDDGNPTISSVTTSQNEMSFYQRAITVHKQVRDDNIVNKIIDNVNKGENDNNININNNDDDDDDGDNYAKQLPTEAMLTNTSVYSFSIV